MRWTGSPFAFAAWSHTLAEPDGFEPPIRESKPRALPLGHGPISQSLLRKRLLHLRCVRFAGGTSSPAVPLRPPGGVRNYVAHICATGAADRTRTGPICLEGRGAATTPRRRLRARLLSLRGALRMVPLLESNQPHPGRTSSRPRPRAAYCLPLEGKVARRAG